MHFYEVVEGGGGTLPSRRTRATAIANDVVVAIAAVIGCCGELLRGRECAQSRCDAVCDPASIRPRAADGRMEWLS
jgi:hypothetical protein